MDKIDLILQKLRTMLLQYNFETVEINGEVNYVYGNLYCIPSYIHTIGFLIQYADSLEEAKKNWHEDGDAFPLEMGEEAILAGLEKELRESLDN